VTGRELYDRCAREAAATVISAYSTSFALACRLLGPRVRPHVRNVYGLVRIADEIVDGAADDLSPRERRIVLDELEADILTALDRGYSANLLVHAFANTARECAIDVDLVRPFFASMRTDLERSEHDAASHDEYVYGSAEVVGLMCLRIFVNAGHDSPTIPGHALIDGARRLGSAFQDINFLRDHADDIDRLGRDYLGLASGRTERDAVLARIDADLDAAAGASGGLPVDCRRAVSTAHGLFAELARRLRAESAATRVRVPAVVKATIAARAVAGLPPRRSVAG